jgi:hypothetical protein
MMVIAQLIDSKVKIREMDSKKEQKSMQIQKIGPFIEYKCQSKKE